MDISVVVAGAVAKGCAPPYTVLYFLRYTAEDGSVSWCERTHEECETLHLALLEKFKKDDAPTMPILPKGPAKPRASELAYAMNYYFTGVGSYKPVRELVVGFLQDASVPNPSSRYSEARATGLVDVWNDASTQWERKYAIIQRGSLALFPSIVQKINDDLEPETVVALRNVSLLELGKAKEGEPYYVPGDKHYPFAIESPGKKIIFSCKSRSSRKEWVSDLHQNSQNKRPRRMSIKREISEETRKALEEMKQILFGGDVPPEVSSRTLLRFLEDRDCDAKRGAALFWDDMLWRKNMDLENLTACSAGEWMRKGKVFVPGSYDKQGRPMVIFRARLHDPSVDTFDTIRLGVYNLERACELVKDNEEVIMIEDLNGFSRSQADNRIAKLFLELVQAHYPGRLGAFYAVNAPWYYRLLFKVVKPWLSLELQSKVHILGGVDELLQYVSKDQLIEELGGTFPFDLDQHLQERARIEGVPLEGPDKHDPKEEVLALYCDRPVATTIKDCLFRGWTKKQGGFVKNFNKRYCVLTRTMLYYYRGTEDDKAEGMLPLRGAVVEDTSANTFTVVVAQKDGIFACSDMKEKEEWVSAIRAAIKKLEAEGCVSILSGAAPSTADLTSSASSGSLVSLSDSGSFSSSSSSVDSRTFVTPTFSLELDADGDGNDTIITRLSVAGANASSHGDLSSAAVRYHQLQEIAWEMQTSKDSLSLPANGKSIVAWLTQHSYSKDDALTVCGDMVSFGLLYSYVSSPRSSPTSSPVQPGQEVPQRLLANRTFARNTDYMFMERLASPVINARFLALGEAKPAQELLAELFLHVRGLVQKYKKSGTVDVHRLRKKAPFRNFTIASAALQKIDPVALPVEQRVPFFLSLFHLLAVHSTLMLDNLKSRFARWRMEHAVSYIVGEHVLSLADIENGILRGNRPAPGSLAEHYFQEAHVSAAAACSGDLDPRLHFFLNAGVFVEDVLDIDWLSWTDLDGSLDRAAKAFVAKDLSVSGAKVTISDVFREFQSDFGADEKAVLRYIAQFAEGDQKAALEAALGADFAVSYTTYRHVRVGAAYLNN